MYIEKLNKILASLFRTKIHRKHDIGNRRSHTLPQKGPWKVLFFGTDEFAVESLKALHEKYVTKVLQRLEVVSVINAKENAVIKYAKENRIALNKWPIEEKISDFHIGIVVSFGHLIPSRIINSFPLGMLNVHGSLLPKWRGAAPISHTLMNGELQTGITVMKIMPKKFDTGPILLQKQIHISKDETLPDLTSKLAKVGADLLKETFDNLLELIQSAKPQDEQNVTYAPKITPNMAIVNWNEMSAKRIYDLHRALLGLYPLTAFFQDLKVRLLDVREIKPTLLGTLITKFEGEIPGYTFKFDCRCWETAVKIYTDNGEWSLRPILCPIEENTIWVVFSVHHLVELNETQLQSFFNHVITYHIFHGRKQFSERAKKDKVKEFYINESSMNIGPYEFLEIYSSNLNISDANKKSSTPSLPEPTTITSEVNGDISIITYLDMIPDKAHEYKFRKMLRKDRFPAESLKLEPLKVDEKKGGKINKSTKRKRETEVAYEVHLPAETVFSDMGAVISFKRTPQSPNVSSVLISTECRNVFLDKQLRKDLNPLAIKLEQLSNFPAELIIANGFKYLYVKVSFLNHTIVTPAYSPSGTMCFELIKCFLCKEFNPEELINCLMSKLLIVKIIGTRITNVIQPIVPSSKKSDKEPKTTEVAVEEKVLLGVAKFDVSDLLKGFWEMRLISSLLHPFNIDYTCVDTSDDEMIHHHSPLTNDILTSFGTSVKIKIRLSYDLTNVHRKILRSKDILNRIFFILEDIKLVNDILENVSSHNSNLLKTYRFLNKNEEDSKVQTIPKDILTGFVINWCEKYYIFLEGLSNGHLLHIWKMVADLPFQNKCVYYNSSYVFLARLYEDFVSFGGVVHIEFSTPLETELRKCTLYIGESKRTVPANLMKKMGLITLAPTIKSLCQACLFPDLNAVKAFLDDIQKIRLKYSEQSKAN